MFPEITIEVPVFAGFADEPRVKSIIVPLDCIVCCAVGVVVNAAVVCVMSIPAMANVIIAPTASFRFVMACPNEGSILSIRY